MLRRPESPWTPFEEPPSRRASRSHELLADRTRWLWLLPLAGGFLTVLGWVFTHDPGPGLSDRSWLILTLAAGLVVLLAVHRRGGPLLRTVRLRRVLTEYVLVAVLAVLLATSGAAHQPKPKPNPSAAAKPRTAAAAPARCPDPSLAHAPSWLACVWHRAMDPPPTPSTTSRRNHR
jgi:hypothetical protein